MWLPRAGVDHRASEKPGDVGLAPSHLQRRKGLREGGALPKPEPEPAAGDQDPALHPDAPNTLHSHAEPPQPAWVAGRAPGRTRC